jgi:hypothetical protein
LSRNGSPGYSSFGDINQVHDLADRVARAAVHDEDVLELPLLDTFSEAIADLKFEQTDALALVLFLP